VTSLRQIICSRKSRGPDRKPGLRQDCPNGVWALAAAEAASAAVAASEQPSDVHLFSVYRVLGRGQARSSVSTHWGCPFFLFPPFPTLHPSLRLHLLSSTSVFSPHLFLSPLFRSFSLPSLPFLSWVPTPQSRLPAIGSGERCKLSHLARTEPNRQTVSVHSEVKKQASNKWRQRC